MKKYIYLKCIGSKFLGRDYVIIGTNVVLNYPERITFGDRVIVHDNCYFQCNGELIIGNDVMIAQNVSIYTNSHVTNFRDIPMNIQGETNKRIVIEDDVWIGTGVVILEGVHIGKGAIVGANSLVNKDVPAYAVVGGVPARHIRYRTSIENVEE